MKNLYTLLITLTIAYSGFSQDYQFGIVHNTDYNFSVVAVPSFDGTNTDISDIGFALMLPAGDADIINVSQFNGRDWTSNQVTAAQLTGAGLGDGTRDAFVLNLPPGQTLLSHTTDTPFVLVSFDISNMPTSGLLELLSNTDPIAIGLGGAVNSFYNSNIDNTTTQDYFGGLVPGQEDFMLETLSIDDIELENYTIAVYPNPAVDILHVSTELEVLELKLYDILGKQVIALRNTKSMTVEQLRSGAYFLKIKTIDGVVTKRIIKE
ncbi:T9SS type A sorting domain-containing protein [uncultured Psychroserpens sp.]|uniref:T9SS type A sorting domain-containing protein n=1 Tax=uncultured Psychroserpens sp. TaxID=255436 RepID=UPI002635D372|nr:T9SS type A sorting domain-containing protein [uncultured Psychroserpens sp.]